MTNTINNTLSNRPRRSLNDTIAHLDQMIDGLSEAIPGTIRDTLQESVSVAVSEGVRTALVEILSNADFLALLRSTLAQEPVLAVPVAAAQPTLLKSLLSKVASMATTACWWSWNQLCSAGAATADLARKVVNRLVALRQRLQTLHQVRKPLLLAFVVGGLAAVVALFAPNWVAATMSGVGGACVTMAVQVGWWVRRNFATFAMASD